MITWDCLGPIVPGGTVFTLDAAQGKDGAPDIYVGTAAGIHRSVDGGVSWTHLAVPFTGGSVQTLTLSPQFVDDRTILAAGGVYGVLRSVDAGQTWNVYPVSDSASQVTSLALSPRFAVDGVALAGTANDGVYRSTDHGLTWRRASFGLFDLGILSLATSPDWSDHEIGFAVSEAGLYRTTNGGRGWRLVEGDIEDQLGLTVVVSPDFGHNGTAFVGTEGQGIWRSTDQGRNWHKVGLDGQWVNHLAFSNVAHRGAIYAGTAEQGLWRSRDGGSSWQQVNAELAMVLSLATAGDWVLAGVYRQGVYVSDDGGNAWHWRGHTLAAQNLSVLHALDESMLLTAGADVGIHRSEDGGASWHRLERDVQAAINCFAHSQDGTVFAASADGVMRSPDRGQHWTLYTCPGNTGLVTCVCPAPGYPQDRRVWAGTSTGTLYTSEDGGETWSVLNRSLEGEQILVVAPTDESGEGLLIGSLGIADGGEGQARIWRSQDGGRDLDLWLEETVASPWLAFAPGRRQGSLLGVGPYVYDLGTDVRRQMPAIVDEFTRVLSVASLDGVGETSVVLAGTNRGLYVSWGSGDDWEIAHKALGEQPILALTAVPGRRSAYAMTLGGTLWRARIAD